jgi:outer membrane protein assembly factor BamB
MKKLTSVIVAFLMAGSALAADDLARQYTRPTVPSREALDRLNLKLAWRIYVPTDGRRDGIYSVQLLGDLMLVQNRSGLITALNPEDGSTLWSALPGHTYRVTQTLGYNTHSIYAVEGVNLFALDRKTGKLRWQMIMPQGPSAPPAADDQAIYLALGIGELFAYQVPEGLPIPPPPADTSADKASPPAVAPATSGTDYVPAPVGRANDPATPALAKPALPERGRPRLLWNYRASTRLEQAPLQTRDLLVLAGVDGLYFASSKVTGQPQYRFRAQAPLSAPLAQWGNTGYVASQDFNVYAVDMVAGQIIWRFTGGAPILRKPAVTDEDLYVTAERAGLARLKRVTGEEIWRNLNANHFLANNPKFVYATDRSNRLLILDRARGTQLAVYDTRDYVVPINNELTDRLFLAANDGLFLCLHDRDYPTALRLKETVSQPAEPTPEAQPAEKPAEKPEAKDAPEQPKDKGAEKDNK